MNRNSRRVVITGVGPLTAIGSGKKAFFEALLAGRSGIGRLTRFDTAPFGAKCAAEIRDWEPTAFFPPQRLRRMDRYAQLALASALLALEDAGLPWSRERPQERVGVSFGTALAGICGAEEEHARFLAKGIRGVNQMLALQIFGGAAHANIAMECGFQGLGTTNSNSCASGVIAVGEALRYLREGRAEVMVAGAAEAPLSPLTFGAFDRIRTMSRWEGEPRLACRPFDLHRDGFVMGEGAASLVLEELGHAERRGAPIYAEVLGYGLNNEAHHMTTPLPGGERVAACMREALADAGVEPEAVDYINAHASSTQLNDANEIAAIRQVFGPHAERLAISGTKAFTGHPLGATGAIESVIGALAIRKGFLPPTLHWQTPDPLCDLDIIPLNGRHQPVRCLLNNAFGFGGINASIVLGALE
ncbi:MAG TPA: beta-ketoacyl-[acyl-carrier-protein] synthase family protein [Chthoniobacteraceae bacterium]|nr:beta-ketoacyl-[acyl-carrier-protein] synthase family protein [Chthoniobacteraceae bacterium]